MTEEYWVKPTLNNFVVELRNPNTRQKVKYVIPEIPGAFIVEKWVYDTLLRNHKELFAKYKPPKKEK